MIKYPGADSQSGIGSVKVKKPDHFCLGIEDINNSGIGIDRKIIDRFKNAGCASKVINELSLSIKDVNATDRTITDKIKTAIIFRVDNSGWLPFCGKAHCYFKRVFI
ncbi:MAG: hypothetical protein C0615_10540 [Desulfuromonas sp.]|nr:MAG: hypothetical protein C0615_10540 [Desulfuromonas sp.]